MIAERYLQSDESVLSADPLRDMNMEMGKLTSTRVLAFGREIIHQIADGRPRGGGEIAVSCE